MLLPKEPTEGLEFSGDGTPVETELLRGGPTLSTYSDFREWFDSRKHDFGKCRFGRSSPTPNAGFSLVSASAHPT